MDKTLDYYNKNAKAFVKRTYNLDFSNVQDKFLSYFTSGSKLLDLGCGSGRDSVYFINHGMIVDSVDGSSEICKIASQVAGIPVKKMKFDELSFINTYDGIWACASLLHLNIIELKSVLSKVVRALKTYGFLYISFKYGDFSGIRNERYFMDMNEASFTKIVSNFPQLRIVEMFITNDIRKDRNEQWFNVILQKV